MHTPTIVCLCGSTKFREAFEKANHDETLHGKIVLTVGVYQCDVPSLKESLDLLHRHKIDMADEILVLNVGYYIGESTAREIAYAHSKGKHIRYLNNGGSA